MLDSTGSEPMYELVSSRDSQHVDLEQLAVGLPEERNSTRSKGEASSNTDHYYVPKVVLGLLRGVQNPSHKQVEHVLMTEDGFFHLHRHWLIAKSLSHDYQQATRRAFSHSPEILINGYQSVLELLSAREVEFRGAKTSIDFTRGAKCLEKLVQSNGSLNDVEDAAVILLLGQILFVYNILISWPCTHLIIRNTLLTTRDWFPKMLMMPEWDAATLTPVFVDIIQCLVKRDLPVIRVDVSKRLVVDRFLGVSSSLLPRMYDICACSYRLKTHTSTPIPPRFSAEVQEEDDDVFSTVERQIISWGPVLPSNFFTQYTRVETTAMLAQASMYKAAALLLIHRLRYPIGVNDQIGQRYAELIYLGLSSFSWSEGSQYASGIGSNFLLLLVTLELPEKGSSLIWKLEPFRFGPKQYIRILEFVEYVRVRRNGGFDGLWFDLAEEGLYGVALP